MSTAHTTHQSHAMHATSASANGWSTKKIAILSMLCAVSAICTLVLQLPILPGVTFLKYDPSGIIALLAGIAYGPAAGAVVSVLPYLVHLATESGLYGTVMAILATLTMTLPAAAIIHGRTTSTKVMIFGLVVGGICSVIACIGGNLVVTPIYTGMSTDAVIGLILPALLPFNIVKVLINGIACALIGKSALRALNVFSPHA